MIKPIDDKIKKISIGFLCKKNCRKNEVLQLDFEACIQIYTTLIIIKGLKKTIWLDLNQYP